MTKIYHALLCNHIEPKIENILRKNQNGFQRNRSMTSQILTICWIVECVHAKNLEATILFVNFSKAFDSIHRGKMGQILLAYGLFKETVTAIMILYKNMKVKFHSPDGDRASAYLSINIANYIYIYIYVCICWQTIVKGDPKAPF